MSDRKKIARDSAYMLAGSLAGQAFGLLRGLIIPALFSPAQYGMWRNIKLIWQYGLYLHLGSMPTLNRELPGLAATERWEEHDRQRRAGLWGGLFVTTIAIALVLLATLGDWMPASPGDAWAVRIAVLGLLAQQFQTYQQMIFRVRSEFGLLTLTDVAKGLLGLLLVVGLGWLWGVLGMVLGFVGALSAVAVASFFRVPYDRPQLPDGVFAGQIRQGLPLMSISFLAVAIDTSGQVITNDLNLTQAGYFGIALMFGSMIYALPKVLNKVLYPRFLAAFARGGGSRKETGALMRLSLRLTAVTAAPAAAVGALVAGPFFTLWYTRYEPALPVAYVLILSMTVVSLRYAVQNALIAIRRHNALITLQVAALVLSYGLGWAGAAQTGDATGVAVGVAAASSSVAVLVVGLALVGTGSTAAAACREVLLLLTPIAVLTAITVGAISQAPEQPLAQLTWSLWAIVAVIIPAGLMFRWVWNRTLAGSFD